MKKNYKNILLSLFATFFFEKLAADSFYDYPMIYLVEACQITQERYNPNEFGQEEVLEGRKRYSICMNFILSLSTTLNSRCINLGIKNLMPEESFTYADLSEVHTTQDLIKEILSYSKKYPQFDNQIAWLHAAKAISQKWPCRKNNSK
tara:strand:+ start:6356 stop:6799 length:444 start_codon:yes stop_codon:yes gene_type:complete